MLSMPLATLAGTMLAMHLATGADVGDAIGDNDGENDGGDALLAMRLATSAVTMFSFVLR